MAEASLLLFIFGINMFLLQRIAILFVNNAREHTISPAFLDYIKK